MNSYKNCYHKFWKICYVIREDLRIFSDIHSRISTVSVNNIYSSNSVAYGKVNVHQQDTAASEIFKYMLFMRYSQSSTALNPNLPSRNSEKFGYDALKLCPVWASKKLQLIWQYQIFRLWVSIFMSWNCRKVRFMITHHKSVGYGTGKHLRWDLSKPGKIFYTQKSFHLDHFQNRILNILLLL